MGPTKAELITLAIKFKDLTIDGIEDKAGYKKVDEARKELQRAREMVKIRGEEMREEMSEEMSEEASKFVKAVIAHEKDLVDTIDLIEQDLITKQNRYTP